MIESENFGSALMWVGLAILLFSRLAIRKYLLPGKNVDIDLYEQSGWDLFVSMQSNVVRLTLVVFIFLCFAFANPVVASFTISTIILFQIINEIIRFRNLIQLSFNKRTASILSGLNILQSISLGIFAAGFITWQYSDAT